MTREEAMDFLIAGYPASCYKEWREAVDMAIEALAKMEIIERVIDMPLLCERDDRRRYAKIADIVKKDLTQEIEK